MAVAKTTKAKPKKAAATRKTKKEDLPAMARNLFEAAGKEAYYLGDRAIHNLEELVESLEDFTGDHAQWVADWMEYLGDSKTARKIRMKTGDFKAIIQKRYKELKKHQK